MAEEGEPQYKIVNLATNQESNSSRDFTGKGRATYLNGDIYEGDYVDGVIQLSFSSEPAKESTGTRREATDTKEIGKRI